MANKFYNAAKESYNKASEILGKTSQKTTRELNKATDFLLDSLIFLEKSSYPISSDYKKLFLNSYDLIQKYGGNVVKEKADKLKKEVEGRILKIPLPKSREIGSTKSRSQLVKIALGEIRKKNFVFAIISSISLIFALVFTSFSLTGNVVAGLNETNSLWIGTVLFVLGLVFAFLYFKGKRDNGKN